MRRLSRGGATGGVAVGDLSCERIKRTGDINKETIGEDCALGDSL